MEILMWASVDPTYCEKEGRAYTGNLTLQGSNRAPRRNRTLTRTPKLYSVIVFFCIVCRYYALRHTLASNVADIHGRKASTDVVLNI